MAPCKGITSYRLKPQMCRWTRSIRDLFTPNAGNLQRNCTVSLAGVAGKFGGAGCTLLTQLKVNVSSEITWPFAF